MKPILIALAAEIIMCGNAHADWLTHHVHILEMNGDSYRLKQSKRRQRQT